MFCVYIYIGCLNLNYSLYDLCVVHVYENENALKVIKEFTRIKQHSLGSPTGKVRGVDLVIPQTVLHPLSTSDTTVDYYR